MGIFDKIKDAIFHRAEAAPKPAAPTQSAPTGATPQPTPSTTPAATPPMTNAAPSGSSPEPQTPNNPAPPVAGAPTSAAPASPQPTASASGVNTSTGSNPAQGVDVAAILDRAAKDSGQKLDWRHSVVDTMKALGLDSSLSERKELAQELGYTGDTGDSATMNVWLQKALMKKLAENGGTVPAELRD